jgi:hypothetical protein
MPYRTEKVEKGFAVVYFLPYDPEGDCEVGWFDSVQEAQTETARLNRIAQAVKAKLEPVLAELKAELNEKPEKILKEMETQAAAERLFLEQHGERH